MNKIPQVYIMTNNVNQKVYIGKTNNLQERWNGHRNSQRLDGKRVWMDK